VATGHMSLHLDIIYLPKGVFAILWCFQNIYVLFIYKIEEKNKPTKCTKLILD